MMVASYIAGQRYRPIAYPLGRMLAYVAVAAAIYVLGLKILVTGNEWANYGLRALLIMAYVAFVWIVEKRNTARA